MTPKMTQKWAILALNLDNSPLEVKIGVKMAQNRSFWTQKRDFGHFGHFWAFWDLGVRGEANSHGQARENGPK